MRIAHVLPTLATGGAERVVRSLAQHATAAGHEVTLLFGWPGDPSDPGEGSLPPGVRVEYTQPARAPAARRYAAALRWVWRNRRRLQGFDIVHCHLTYGAFLGTLVKLLRRVLRADRPRVVETYHGVGAHLAPAHRWVHSRMARQRDALVLMAEDDYWRSFVAAHPWLDCRVILNSADDPEVGRIPAEARLAFRRRIGIPDGCRFVVSTVGRLEPDRMPWVYVPIFAALASAFGEEVHCVVAGGGSEHERLLSLLREEGLEGQVHLIGAVPHSRETLAITDLYLTLNVGDVTGIAALEAALAGLPIVAVQMLDGYQATPDDWIWSSTDPAEVGERAVALLRDGERRRALAARQLAHARAHHGIETMALAYEQLYRDLLNRDGAVSAVSVAMDPS